MDYDIIHEQIIYYRARAQEDDETTEGTEELKGAFYKPVLPPNEGGQTCSAQSIVI